jgi:hypothetical protein
MTGGEQLDGHGAPEGGWAVRAASSSWARASHEPRALLAAAVMN